MFQILRKVCQHNAVHVIKRHKGLVVDSKVLQKLEEGYNKLIKSDSKSLLKKHLTPEVYQNLRTKQTASSTLLDCIQSGLIHHDSSCGVYAACPQSYKVFAELFDPIIEHLHLGFKSTDKQPPVDFGDPTTFEDIDPNKNFIASVQMQCTRSLRGYPFNPCMTVDQYNEIEDKLHCISSGFQDELEGEYRSLLRLDKDVRTELVHKHRAFRVDDRFLVAANACQHWPTGRGLFRNSDWTFMVWCNGEEHLCVTSLQGDGNFCEVYARLIRGVRYIEKYLPFASDDRLGFLSFCPTNLGTALRVSVCVKIPKLASKKGILEDAAGRHKLLIQAIPGRDGFYDISSRRRLGLTEFNVVSDLYCGVREVIQLEKGEKEPPMVRRETQPAPPHIDPQKALKSGLIDDRKRRRLADVNVRQTTVLGELDNMKSCTADVSVKQAAVRTEGVKEPDARNVAATKLTVKPAIPREESSKKVQSEVVMPSLPEEASHEKVGKPKVKVPCPKQATAIKSQPGSIETESKLIHKMPAKCLKKKKTNSSPEKSQKSSKSEKKVKKKCKTKASQSTDPCIRAGIKMPTPQGAIKTKQCSSGHVLEKKERVPRICNNVKSSSQRSSSDKKDEKD